MHIYAEGNNTLTLRIANLDDKFDKGQKPKGMNITEWAINFYSEAHLHMEGK